MKRRLLLWCLLLAAAVATHHAKAQKKAGQAYIDSLTTQLQRLPDDTNKVRLLNDLSFAYRNTDATKGIAFGTQSRALASRLHWKWGEGFACNSVGLNYLAKADYPRALEYLQNAVRLEEEAGDPIAVGSVMGNIGTLYYLQGESAKALDYLLKSLPAARAGNNRKNELATLGGIGNVYHQMGDYHKSAAYLDTVVRIAHAIGDYENAARNLGNLANEYRMLKDYRRSLKGSFEALEVAAQYGYKSIHAVTLGNIGETYLALAKDPAAATSASLPNAISYLKRGVAACDSIGYLGPLAEFSDQLSEAYARAGNYQDALAMYRQSVRSNDSVFSIANKVKITNLETQRALELKDKQIEIDRLAVAKKRNERGFFIVGMGLLLVVIGVVFRNYRVQRVLNTALSLAKEKVERHTEELDATNQELNTTLTALQETQQQLIRAEKQKEAEMLRSRISQDIHDDISSELTRISWVSELAKKKVAGAEYNAMPGLLEKITASSRETVMKLGEIIWAVNPKNDSLASLLAYMRTHITRFLAETAMEYRIDFPQDVPQISINPELKRNLYLVLKEALNNAAKYAAAAHITVSFTLQESHYSMCIADDGKGMEAGVVQGGGNGLNNMRSRMEAVRGTCRFESAPGAGTRVCCEGVLY